MDTSEFWQAVEKADAEAGGDMKRKCRLIETALAKLSARDAIGFLRHFDELMVKAYSFSLWGAADILRQGPCSNDKFYDFRTVLISRGRDVFERAVQNPDSLARYRSDEDWFFEGFSYAVHDGVRVAAGFLPDHSVFRAEMPAGKPIQGDACDLFSKLAARIAEDCRRLQLEL
jgi:hypothetical protein